MPGPRVRILVLTATLLVSAAVSAQAQGGVLTIHSVRQGKEYYTGSTYLGFHKDGQPGELFLTDAAHPGHVDVEPGTLYRVALVTAGDLVDKTQCLLKNSQSGPAVSAGAGDTVDVMVPVDFIYCQLLIATVRSDSGATGSWTFHAGSSWESHENADGLPFLAPGGPFDVSCTLTEIEGQCSDLPDKAVAYGSDIVAEFVPGPNTMVNGRTPFGVDVGAALDPAHLGDYVGKKVQVTGVATVQMFFDQMKLTYVAPADVSVMLTGSSVADTVVTSTFQVHNASATPAVAVVLTSGNAVVRAGAGQIAKVQVTVPTGTCEGEACGIFTMTPGSTASVSVQTITARLGDNSSAPVGANACSQVKIVSQNDPDPSNNVASCVSGISTPVTVVAGGNPPPSQTVTPGTTAVPVLQFAVTVPPTTTLNGIVLQASGSGSDQVDITGVKLYVDGNANGVVDAGESKLAEGTFGANNGTVTLAVSPGYAINSGATFLVTYDFNQTLASRYGGAVVLAAFLPLAFMPLQRRRRWMAMGAIVLLVGVESCGGDGGGSGPVPPGTTATYSVVLTSATMGQAPPTAVSIPGATITVAP